MDLKKYLIEDLYASIDKLAVQEQEESDLVSAIKSNLDELNSLDLFVIREYLNDSLGKDIVLSEEEPSMEETPLIEDESTEDVLSTLSSFVDNLNDLNGLVENALNAVEDVKQLENLVRVKSEIEGLQEKFNKYNDIKTEEFGDAEKEDLSGVIEEFRENMQTLEAKINEMLPKEEQQPIESSEETDEDKEVVTEDEEIKEDEEVIEAKKDDKVIRPEDDMDDEFDSDEPVLPDEDTEKMDDLGMDDMDEGMEEVADMEEPTNIDDSIQRLDDLLLEIEGQVTDEDVKESIEEAKQELQNIEDATMTAEGEDEMFDDLEGEGGEEFMEESPEHLELEENLEELDDVIDDEENVKKK